MTEIVTEQTDGWEATVLPQSGTGVNGWVWQESKSKYGVTIWKGQNHELFALISWNNLNGHCPPNIDLRPLHVHVGGDRVFIPKPQGVNTIGAAQTFVENHTKAELFQLSIAKKNRYGGDKGW